MIAGTARLASAINRRDIEEEFLFLKESSTRSAGASAEGDGFGEVR